MRLLAAALRRRDRGDVDPTARRVSRRLRGAHHEELRRRKAAMVRPAALQGCARIAQGTHNDDNSHAFGS